MGTMLDTSKLVNKENVFLTDELQSLIDSSSKLLFKKGRYLTGPLFLHSNMEIIFEEGATLILTNKEEYFKKIPTRIAGIEMDGYPALLNVINSNNVKISGKGILIGQGEYWYAKYWGKDTKGGMRKVYDAKGLRWACDYDCFRPKMILVQQSYDIHLSNLELYDSPFWNIHILYSNNIHLSSMKIISENPISPSTDGIDIDSSSFVYISSCYISTNDDGISLKSGRDNDGIKINKKTNDIFIENCEFQKGYGLSIGSELSAGIEKIYAKNLSFKHSSCGFRIKSSFSRKGYVKNVFLSNLNMYDVKYPIYCYLDWNRKYNENSLPEGYKGFIPSYWYKLLDLPSNDIMNTSVNNILIDGLNITSLITTKSCLFTLKGFSNSYMKNIVLKNINGNVDELGSYENCEEPKLIDFNLDISGNIKTIPGEFDNR